MWVIAMVTGIAWGLSLLLLGLLVVVEWLKSLRRLLTPPPRRLPSQAGVH